MDSGEAPTEDYDYDANGNRDSTGYTVGTNNRLSASPGYTYTYDDEGNMLSKTKVADGTKEEYTWDYRNRLTKVTFKNSGGTVVKTVDQSYDVFNQWVRSVHDSNGATAGGESQRFFIYDNGQIVLEFDGDYPTDLTHRYLWGPAVDQILADEQITSISSAGTVIWPMSDHLGTTRDLATYNASTNTTTVVNHRWFDSFGKLVSESNGSYDLLFGYTGRPFDENSGLQNNLHRWYMTGIGQWISEDPIGFGGGDANTRRYVFGSPLSHTDPNGLITLGFGIGGSGSLLFVHGGISFDFTVGINPYAFVNPPNRWSFPSDAFSVGISATPHGGLGLGLGVGGDAHVTATNANFVSDLAGPGGQIGIYGPPGGIELVLSQDGNGTTTAEGLSIGIGPSAGAGIYADASYTFMAAAGHNSLTAPASAIPPQSMSSRLRRMRGCP